MLEESISRAVPSQDDRPVIEAGSIRSDDSGNEETIFNTFLFQPKVVQLISRCIV